MSKFDIASQLGFSKNYTVYELNELTKSTFEDKYTGYIDWMRNILRKEAFKSILKSGIDLHNEDVVTLTLQVVTPDICNIKFECRDEEWIVSMLTEDFKKFIEDEY